MSFNSVIFDLGDVLFTWSPSTPRSPLPAKTVRSILRSYHWLEYEKGNLEEDEVYSLVAQEFAVTSADVKAAFLSARDSLQADPAMLEILGELKQIGFCIYAMSNISAPDWAVLSTKASPEAWALFDHVFTSAAARERKPNIGFYKQVIEKAGLDPSQTIFVDDKVENVLTARSFGMHGIVFKDRSDVIKELKNLCFDSAERARMYLSSNKKRHFSMTSNNVMLKENFSQLLILEATGDESLVDYVKHTGQFNFFQGCSVLTNEEFPNDMDTTSIGLTISKYVNLSAKQDIMDDMLNYRNSDGIVQVYFDHSRPRIDPVVCVNVLTLFFSNGRGHELPETLDWVEKILWNRAYISGTSYYNSADQFLYFVSRLMQASAHVRQRFQGIFEERVKERFGTQGDSLSLAARVIAAATVGLMDDRDLTSLLSTQSPNGSWADGWFYRYGGSGILIKNDGVTTAMALKAIELAKVLQASG